MNPFCTVARYHLTSTRALSCPRTARAVRLVAVLKALAGSTGAGFAPSLTIVSSPLWPPAIPRLSCNHTNLIVRSLLPSPGIHRYRAAEPNGAGLCADRTLIRTDVWPLDMETRNQRSLPDSDLFAAAKF